MGYIPPTTNNQYHHYGDRELKNRYEPFQIFPVERTRRAAGMTDGGRLAKLPQDERKFNKKSSPVQELTREYRIEEIYSEITGKGRYFNEVV
ncbi:hypothetical protein J27TS8_43790 [Robertmurraya siralis]|uniref:Uncharacterized protein n=1 Tax=Robertmurraya siralis TaxID=77777 RepID=A0A920BWD3_9BACI|nr:hypothetical protein [Robertmurraya siralis]PAE20696.1 hypothetical protein CHH80_10465 [Bacillus sp. 7504-2]GIN64386.1 hypothetical protein J27TS8_43790 [Robertmurraya siralis]